MTRFIQICASQNDLFALDEEGEIYQYHFNVKTWVKLIPNRESEERIRSGGAWRQPTSAQDGEGRVGDGKGQESLGVTPGQGRETDFTNAGSAS